MTKNKVFAISGVRKVVTHFQTNIVVDSETMSLPNLVCKKIKVWKIPGQNLVENRYCLPIFLIHENVSKIYPIFFFFVNLKVYLIYVIVFYFYFPETIWFTFQALANVQIFILHFAQELLSVAVSSLICPICNGHSVCSVRVNCAKKLIIVITLMKV